MKWLSFKHRCNTPVRMLQIWMTPDRFSKWDVFWFVVINTLVIDVLMVVCAVVETMFTGQNVLVTTATNLVVATPIAILLMYLGGTALRLNVDLRSQLQETQTALEQQANHDFLTGLANRRAFAPVFKKTWDEATADGDFVFLSTDLDGFKSVNDQYGHAAGDAVLIETARRLNTILAGHAHIIVRLGGDEFAALVMADRLESAGGREQLAQKLCDALCQPMFYNGQTLKIGISIGVATMSVDFADRSALAMAADAALRHAKSSGKGRVSFYDTMTEHKRRAS